MRLMKSLIDSEHINLYTENEDFILSPPDEHICNIERVETEKEHAEQVTLRFKDGASVTIELNKKPDEH